MKVFKLSLFFLCCSLIEKTESLRIRNLKGLKGFGNGNLKLSNRHLQDFSNKIYGKNIPIFIEKSKNDKFDKLNNVEFPSKKPGLDEQSLKKKDVKDEQAQEKIKHISVDKKVLETNDLTKISGLLRNENEDGSHTDLSHKSHEITKIKEAELISKIRKFAKLEEIYKNQNLEVYHVDAGRMFEYLNHDNQKESNKPKVIHENDYINEIKSPRHTLLIVENVNESSKTENLINKEKNIENLKKNNVYLENKKENSESLTEGKILPGVDKNSSSKPDDSLNYTTNSSTKTKPNNSEISSAVNHLTKTENSSIAQHDTKSETSSALTYSSKSEISSSEIKPITKSEISNSTKEPNKSENSSTIIQNKKTDIRSTVVQKSKPETSFSVNQLDKSEITENLQGKLPEETVKRIIQLNDNSLAKVIPVDSHGLITTEKGSDNAIVNKNINPTSTIAKLSPPKLSSP